MLAAITWQLAVIAQRRAREALPIALALLLGCAGLLVIGLEFFFGGPIVMSVVAVGCAAVVVGLRRPSAVRDSTR
ncbi:MAG TPA: hypothetical protein VF219_08840 [Vicinamibacterales bacterium]